MYVYAVIAKLEDYFGITPVVACIEKTSEKALAAVKREKKHYCNDTVLEIKRFRVDKKDKVFLVVSEEEDAGAYFNHFLHLTTSEKRANGWKKNYENRKLGYNLHIITYIIEE